MYRLTDGAIEQGIENILQDKPEMLGACLDAIYQQLDGAEAVEEFHKRHMTSSCGVITVYTKEKVKFLVSLLAPEIQDKVVVEIGAGVGLLAIGMATIAKQVFAIESDPAWSWAFTKVLYDIKPPNLTFIFGRAETMVGKLMADVAIIITRSGHEEMQKVAKELAPKVIDIYKDFDMWHSFENG